jgi:hypothetical protein
MMLQNDQIFTYFKIMTTVGKCVSLEDIFDGKYSKWKWSEW